MCPLANLPAAYQIFAQPIFDTMESHIKAFMIKREKKRAGLNAANTVAGAGATRAATLTAPSTTASASAGYKLAAPNSTLHTPHQPSPFDAITDPSAGVQMGAINDMDKMEAGGKGSDDDDGCELAPALSTLSSRRMSVRVSAGGMVVQNSAPLPDLLPEKGTLVCRRSRRSSCSLVSVAGSWELNGLPGPLACLHVAVTSTPRCWPP
jgi:hypothetical protein